MNINDPNTGRPMQDIPPGLNDGEQYVWARIKLGYPVSPSDRAVVEAIRDRGLLPEGSVPITPEGTEL